VGEHGPRLQGDDGLSPPDVLRALLSDGDVADGLYRESIDRLGRTPLRVELARVHLLYGEWLRRESRRVDARAQLRTAHEMFASMGVAAFADRARRELLATGGHVRKRTVETRDELTAQEAQIARLAREGLTNPEIGTRLFISPRHQPAHGAVPPAQGVHQARDQLPQPARPRPFRATCRGPVVLMGCVKDLGQVLG
jgi:hypothetical protein